MKCDEISTLIHAYHDEELDAANTLQVEKHLADCPQCFVTLRNLDALRNILGNNELRFSAPSTLIRSVRNQLGEAKRASQPPLRERISRFWLPGLSGLSVAAIAVLLVLRIDPARQEDSLSADLTSSHIRSLMVDHLTDVTSTDQHTVKPWFDGKLDFAPPVKELRESGFPLLGGRLEYVDRRPVAAVVYGRQKHLINLFIWPNTADRGEAAPQSATHNGYHLVHWTINGMNCWAVSDLNEQELKDFAERWREEPVAKRMTR